LPQRKDASRRIVGRLPDRPKYSTAHQGAAESACGLPPSRWLKACHARAEILVVRRWFDSSSGVRAIGVRMLRHGYDLPLTTDENGWGAILHRSHVHHPWVSPTLAPTRAPHLHLRRSGLCADRVLSVVHERGPGGIRETVVPGCLSMKVRREES